MMARIARLESIKQVASGQGETFSSVHPDYRTGMIAIERLVCSATRADEQTLPMPAGGEERIMDHLDKLVERMAHMEKRRMEAHSGDWDPATSLWLICCTLADFCHFWWHYFWLILADLYDIDCLMALPSEFGHSTIFLDRCRQKHLLGILASSLFVCLLSLCVWC